jgi:sortase A
VRVFAAERKTRARRVSFLAPEVRTNLTPLDETPLKQPRVHVGEYALRGLAVDPGGYSLRQFPMETPCESTFHRPAKSLLHWVQYLLVIVSLIGAGIYGWFYAEARVYQTYESWRLDQMAKHGPAELETFLASYLGLRAIEAAKEPPAPLKLPTELPFSLPRVPGKGQADPLFSPPWASVEGQAELSFSLPPAPIAVGALIGRIEIPRLSLSSIVLQGDSDQVLRKGVGHIPSTSLPGGSGNVAIAGHRDTFFRALKDIRREDDITLTTTTGTYRYRVDSVQVVRPDDVQVLAPSDRASLTLVTCYPFYFVGSAPKRYVVRAEQIESSQVVQQRSASTLPPRPAGPDRPSPDDRSELATAHPDQGESVGMLGNRILFQLETKLQDTYPPICRRLKVWENASLAQLRKERDWLNTRIAAAVESYMNGDY